MSENDLLSYIKKANASYEVARKSIYAHLREALPAILRGHFFDCRVAKLGRMLKVVKEFKPAWIPQLVKDLQQILA